MDPEDNDCESVFDSATVADFERQPSAKGMTRPHIEYLTALFQYFRRETRDGGVEYIVGEPVMQLFLRESTQGLQTTEAFLVERGLINLTPRGRQLTELGISRAAELITAGQGTLIVEADRS